MSAIPAIEKNNPEKRKRISQFRLFLLHGLENFYYYAQNSGYIIVLLEIP